MRGEFQQVRVALSRAGRSPVSGFITHCTSACRDSNRGKDKSVKYLFHFLVYGILEQV